MLPLIAGALGLVRGGIGLEQGLSESNARKKLLAQAYAQAQQRLGHRQATQTEDLNESLTGRGMTAGGEALNTLAAGARSDLVREQGYDTADLTAQHTQAVNDEKAARANSILGAITGGINTAASVYSAGKEFEDAKAPAAAPSAAPAPSGTLSGGGPASIRDAMGVGSVGAFGIHPTDPFGHPDSAWNPARQVGAGQPNFSFNAVS